MMTDSMGQLVNQTIGSNPNDRAIQANSPESGFISRFFHTSALTVGTVQGVIQVTPAHASWLYRAKHAGRDQVGYPDRQPERLAHIAHPCVPCVAVAAVPHPRGTGSRGALTANGSDTGR